MLFIFFGGGGTDGGFDQVLLLEAFMLLLMGVPDDDLDWGVAFQGIQGSGVQAPHLMECQVLLKL